MNRRDLNATIGLILGALLILGSPEQGRAQQEKRTEQEDLRAPGEEHKRLNAMAGRWDVVVTYRLGPDREMKGTAQCDAKWVLDGRFLRQDYRSEIQKRPFEVVQYLGFDRSKKRFVELKMDSMDTAVMHNEGSLSDDGRTITCVGERLDREDGRSRPLRTVYTLTDADHFTLSWYTTDSTGKEEKAVELVHTRRAP
ncbi:DUF1579 family protein [Paludisphaera mucosa]|uniref:DUF1579 family protein n=1 Tax=Paludisphaera mucosa TaxID=3030827 RepID=A0ABT6F6J6_9BACT|nr:DUF1579 family protein [Paludisphaera mucosa]MDG3003211.1 DUF1579 family protein [Paludisphaera mucosa]